MRRTCRGSGSLRGGRTCGASRPIARSSPRWSPGYANKRIFGFPAALRRRRAQGQAAEDRDHRAGQPRVPGVRRRRYREDQAVRPLLRRARVLHARHREPLEPGGEPRREAVVAGHHDRRVRVRPDPADLHDGEGARARMDTGVERPRHRAHRRRRRRTALRPGAVVARVRTVGARQARAAARELRLPGVQVRPERRAGARRRPPLLLVLRACDRRAHGRAEPHAGDVRAGDVRLSRRQRHRRTVEVRPG